MNDPIFNQTARRTLEMTELRGKLCSRFPTAKIPDELLVLSTPAMLARVLGGTLEEIEQCVRTGRVPIVACTESGEPLLKLNDMSVTETKSVTFTS